MQRQSPGRHGARSLTAALASAVLILAGPLAAASFAQDELAPSAPAQTSASPSTDLSSDSSGALSTEPSGDPQSEPSASLDPSGEPSVDPSDDSAPPPDPSGSSGAAVPLVIMTHACGSTAIRRATGHIDASDVVSAPSVCLSVLEE